MKIVCIFMYTYCIFSPYRNCDKQTQMCTYACMYNNSNIISKVDTHKETINNLIPLRKKNKLTEKTRTTNLLQGGARKFICEIDTRIQ